VELGIMQYSDRMSVLGTDGALEVLAQARQLEAAGKSIIHLEIGDLDFDTPKNICNAAVKAIGDGHTHYSPASGIAEARSAVAEHISKSRGVDVGSENIVIMPGAKPALFCSMFCTLNPGDEVIVPCPGFPTYESVANYIGAKPVLLRLREENDFRFSTDELTELVTDRTRMIIINSPQNPTGGVLTKQDMEIIHRLAVDRDLWILTDEIYSKMVYDGEFVSIASIPDALGRTIIVDGLSKAYAMTGWRLGYAVAPVKLAEHLAKLAINNFSCTATFAQHALIEALTGPQDEVSRMLREFRKRRDVIVMGLNALPGVTCLNPPGAFYAFANITKTHMTSSEFADFTMHEAGVACLSGTAFGEYGEGFARFAYANSVQNIEEGIRRISASLQRRSS
jgi:aspartate/methionine/tyrosine aminotransferase